MNENPNRENQLNIGSSVNRERNQKAGSSNMGAKKGQQELLTIMRWAARIIGLGFVLLFVIYFFGAGGIRETANLNSAEKLRLTFIPIFFTIGLLIGWKKERLGGAIMVLSVVAFNLVRMIVKRELLGEVEFAVLLIPGILMLLLSPLSKRMKGG